MKLPSADELARWVCEVYMNEQSGYTPSMMVERFLVFHRAVLETAAQDVHERGMKEAATVIRRLMDQIK